VIPENLPIPLRSLIGDLDPAACKLHCAKFDMNDKQHPIDALSGSWERWVTWNRYRPERDEFNRQFIFSLAHDRHKSSRWLFGGVFEVVGRRDIPKALSYDLTLREDLMGPFIRRLVVGFSPSGRAVRLNMDTYLDQMEVVSVLEKPYSGEPFPGHDRINHTFDVLAAAVTQDWQDWRGALQYLKGVYVIHDQQTGKSYVGSACGTDGIWSRLCQYVTSIDGGNKGLRELVGKRGPQYIKENLRFALLEIMPMKTADADVLARENYWKDVLLSREFGLNRN
jgi:hypothetical protein